MSLLHIAVLATVLTLLVQYLISFQLWVPSVRAFPLVSALECLPLHFGVTIDAVFLAVIAGALVVIAVRPLHSIAIVVFVVSNALLVLEDIPRLQPWLYIDAIFFAGILYYKWLGDTTNALMVLRLLLAFTYIWSGFQKFNYAFSVEIFPWLADSVGMKGFFEAHRTFVYLFPALEFSAGFALLIPTIQRVGIVLGIATHLFILWALGPFGANWNTVIWPWNIQMIVWLFLMSWAPGIPWRNLFMQEIDLRTNAFVYMVILVAGVLPVLNYFGHFDNHLSGSLYSSNNPEAIFCYDSTDRSHLPRSARPFQFTNASMGIEFVTLDQWFIAETEAPFYPEERYFRRVGKSLSTSLTKPDSSYVLMNVKDRFTSEQHLVRLSIH